MRDCSPRARSAASGPPDNTTMRWGSAVTSVLPAACRTSRIGGPSSSGAGSGAQDSSGLRWLPSTPAPAILVVLVTTDLAAPEVLVASVEPPQPVARVTTRAID